MHVSAIASTVGPNFSKRFLAILCTLGMLGAEAGAANPESLEVARGATRVSPSEADQVSVAWSADAKKLAWLERKEAGSGVFNVRVKDLEKKGDAAPVTKDADGASGYSLPIWSPDGSHVGFLTTDGYYKTASVAGSGVSTITRLHLTCLGGNAGHVALEGRYYLAARLAGQIALIGIRPDGSLLSFDPLANAATLTAFGPGVRVLERRIAPDHSRVVFAVEEANGTASLYVLERVSDILSGRASKPTSLSDPLVRRLTDGTAYDGVPSFGGDGTTMVMASAPTFRQPQDCVPNSETSDSFYGGGRFDLVAISATGTGPRAPVSALNTVASELFPSLSPDGMRIAFVRDDSGVFQVYSADLAYAGQFAASGGSRVVRDATGTSVSLPDGAAGQSTQFILSIPLQVPDREGRTLPPGVLPVRALRTIDRTRGEPLQSKATVTLAYTEAEVAGLDEATLGAFRYDPTVGKWSLVGGTVDRRNRTVTFQTDTFGVFGVAGFPVAVAHAAQAVTAAVAGVSSQASGSGGCNFAGGRGQPELASALAWLLLLLASAATGTRPRRR